MNCGPALQQASALYQLSNFALYWATLHPIWAALHPLTELRCTLTAWAMLPPNWSTLHPNWAYESITFSLRQQTRYRVMKIEKWIVSRYTSVRYFRPMILNSLLFRSYLCLNVKVFLKIFLIGPLLGEIGLFRVYSAYAERRFFCELGKKKISFSIPKCLLSICQ